jgi:hypothetical protein
LKIEARLYNQEDRQNIVEKEYAVWKPCNKLDDKQLDSYIENAINQFSYTKEQAIVLLYWNRFNLEKTQEDLKRFVPKPNEWTHEEKILFEQAYGMYGKNFTKIRQVVSAKFFFFSIFQKKI